MANIEVRLRGPGISALLELPGAAALERVKAQIAVKVDIPEGRVCLYRCNPETEECIGEKLRESAVTVAEAAANGYLYVMDSRPAAPVPAGGAAAGGGAGAGVGAFAGPFVRLPDGDMPPLFSAIINSAVIGIYVKKTPVSTAVFFSPTQALTAHHDARPDVGDELTGASSPAEKPVRKWTFKVVASSPLDDLVVLEIVKGPTPTHFLPITPQPDIKSLRDKEVWLATFGISVAKMAAEAPRDIDLGSDRQEVKIRALGRRHFVYHVNTGRGDSGGALISKHGHLVGIHLGGWNDASPPPSPGAAVSGATAAPSGAGGRKAAGAAAAAAPSGAGGRKAAGAAAAAGVIKNRERAFAMGLAELGTSSRKSILKLAKQLSAGGYAIYVGGTVISGLLSAESSSLGGAGGGSSAAGGGSGAGQKRRRPGHG